MKITWSLVIYSVICDLPVCFFLCLASAISAATNVNDWTITISLTSIDWMNFALNYAVAFALSMCISLFIPLTAIGRWFTSLFHVRNDTYTGNVKYRLLATLISSIIFFLIISPSLTILNYFILHNQTLQQTFFNWLINAPIMILIGFVSSLISDVGAYKVAHKVDHNF